MVKIIKPSERNSERIAVRRSLQDFNSGIKDKRDQDRNDKLKGSKSDAENRQQVKKKAKVSKVIQKIRVIKKNFWNQRKDIKPKEYFNKRRAAKPTKTDPKASPKEREPKNVNQDNVKLSTSQTEQDIPQLLDVVTVEALPTREDDTNYEVNPREPPDDMPAGSFQTQKDDTSFEVNSRESLEDMMERTIQTQEDDTSYEVNPRESPDDMPAGSFQTQEDDTSFEVNSRESLEDMPAGSVPTQEDDTSFEVNSRGSLDDMMMGTIHSQEDITSFEANSRESLDEMMVETQEHLKAGASLKEQEPVQIKITSWNLDGAKKLEEFGMEFLNNNNSDIICLQNLLCQEKSVDRIISKLKGYEYYYNLDDGSPGLLIATRIKPLGVKIISNSDEFRETVLRIEFKEFQLICVHAPSSGFGLKNLKQKLTWHDNFFNYIKSCQNLNKPLIIAGNFKTALLQIDVANHLYNQRYAGCTREEREKMELLLEQNLIDTYRMFHPNRFGRFTCYSNFLKFGHFPTHGSRIDYFLVSTTLQKQVKDSIIHSDIIKFSHCPITLILEI